MINVEQTIISQYANSATIVQLIKNMDQYIDPRTDIQNFYDYVWNVETAQGFGLDIWGKIVGVSREVRIPVVEEPFGFSEGNLPGNIDYLPFDEGTFADGGGTSEIYTLDDDLYRILILVKALSNISATTAPAINQVLKNFFEGRGKAYVTDVGLMRMGYVFEFQLEPYELAILTTNNVLPRPAGVLVTILQFDYPVLGFSEAGGLVSPLDQGVFLPEGAVINVN